MNFQDFGPTHNLWKACKNMKILDFGATHNVWKTLKSLEKHENPRFGLSDKTGHESISVSSQENAHIWDHLGIDFYWFLLDEVHFEIIFASFFYQVKFDWRILRHCTSREFRLPKKVCFFVSKCAGAYHGSMRRLFFSNFWINFVQKNTLFYNVFFPQH